MEERGILVPSSLMYNVVYYNVVYGSSWSESRESRMVHVVDRCT